LLSRGNIKPLPGEIDTELDFGFTSAYGLCVLSTLGFVLSALWFGDDNASFGSVDEVDAIPLVAVSCMVNKLSSYTAQCSETDLLAFTNTITASEGNKKCCETHAKSIFTA
jgi:hypothetical protein